MNDHLKSLVTMVIPTHYRNKFLKRILYYYKNTEFKILIADSTLEKFTEKLENNVHYFHYPNLSFVEKICDVIKKINTPYMVFCADDDFIIPSSILKSVDFLEKNPEYSTASGNIFFFDEKKMQPIRLSPHKELDYCEKEIFKHLHNTNSLNAAFSQTFVSNFYSVHRISHIHDIITYVRKYEIKEPVSFEHSIYFFSCIRGFHKKMTFFYLARSLCERAEKGIKTFSQFEDLENLKFKKMIVDYIYKHHKLPYHLIEKKINELMKPWLKYYPLQRYRDKIKKIIKLFIPKKILELRRKILSKITGEDFEEWQKIKKIIKKHNQ
ncbi:MAG: TIGR00180 family glycosyltransferase [Parachlamydiales bacterium]|nr:TIGR00180 family glycosyltransferase [Parachlamydiales bacterium]